MQIAERFANAIFERFGGISLIATAVEADGGVVANAQDKVLQIVEEERIVERLRPIPWVGEPEILPHHYAVPVAGFKECIIAHLPNPVADHCEVHVTVVAHGRIVLARTVAQHRLAESPVAAAPDEAPSVDPYLQRTAFF